MTQEEKGLLLRDLCARLPYGVCVHVRYKEGEPCYGKLTARDIQWFIDSKIENIKPYLRPMSSMTEDEYERCEVDTGFSFGAGANKDSFDVYDYIVIDECGCVEVYIKEIVELITWLYKNHFDVNHLIEKGLALEAPEGMYGLKEK